MRFASWLDTLKCGRPRRPIRRTEPRDPRRNSAVSKLTVESLEARTVPAFLTPVDYPVGTSPQAVVSGFFNDDDFLDLAVGNFSDGTVSVLLGNGDGTFQDAVDSSAGGSPSSLVVGDFNSEDDFDDLAVATAEGVSVLLGKGDGTFQDPSPIDLGSSPVSVAVGDFNDDGTMDLVATTNVSVFDGYYYYYYYGPYPVYHTEGAANVLLGNGDGSFSEPDVIALGNGFHTGAAVGDFDNNGKDDFAASNLDFSSVSVLLNDGNGNLQALNQYSAGYYPLSLAAGDVDNDGDDDLVTANYFDNNVGVLLSNGSGGFAALKTYSTGTSPTSVALGDFNNDFNLDIITANPSAVNVLLGRGNGTFSRAIQSASGSGTSAVAVGNFDDDGWLDAATANSSGNNASVLLNDQVWPPANAPSVTINDVSATELTNKTVSLTFTVTLSATHNEDVTIHYSTANGSAAAGSDYTGVSDGTVTVIAGSTTATFTITVLDDREAEPTETFVVNLTTGDAFIADGQGTGSIVDDEPRISIVNVSNVEGNSNGNGKGNGNGNGKGKGKNNTTVFMFKVTLSAEYDQTVTVKFGTEDGTATTADNDYEEQSGTVTFLPGQTEQIITIVVFGDKRRESDEWFAVKLSEASTNVFLLDTQAIGMILDNDTHGKGKP